MRHAAHALRTSAAAFPVSLGLIAGVGQAFNDGWGHGQWDDSLSIAINHALYIEFAVAAATAWAADRSRRRWPSIASGVRTFSVGWATILGATAWGCMAVMVLCLMALGGTAATAAFRMPELGLVLVGFAWTLSSAGLGWLLGCMAPWYASVPLVLLTTWLGNAVAGAETDRWPALFSGLENGGFPAGQPPVRMVLIAQILIFCALACTEVLLSGWALSSPRSRIAALVTPLTLGAGSFAILANTGPERAESVVAASGPRTCGSIPVRTCSWPDDDFRRTAVAAAASKLWEPLRGRAAVPAGVTERGLKIPYDWISISMWSRSPEGLIQQLAEATIDWLWCPDPGRAIEPRAFEDLTSRAMLLARPLLGTPPELLPPGGAGPATTPRRRAGLMDGDPTKALSMRFESALTYVRVHRYLELVGATVCTLLLTLIACRLPVPAFSRSMAGEQTEAIAFYLAPLLCLPLGGLILDGTWSEAEEQAVRTLRVARVVDALAVALLPLVAILPSASELPAGAAEATAQNVFGLCAALTLCRLVVPATLCWALPYACGLLGIMGPENGTWVGLHLCARAPSTTHLAAAILLWSFATSVHAIGGPRSPALRRLFS